MYIEMGQHGDIKSFIFCLYMFTLSCGFLPLGAYQSIRKLKLIQTWHLLPLLNPHKLQQTPKSSQH
jgi:hypothetical protein